MSSKKRASSATAGDDYDSDGGFVEDAPRSKKTKTRVKTEKSRKGSNRDAEPTATAVGGGKAGKDGEVYWELSSKRRIGVQEFKGSKMVNIREYYEKDGEMLPSKKGISLPIDQFNTLIGLLPDIETALMEKGEKIGRPDYSGASAVAAEAAEDEDEDEEPAPKPKQNFEETSEED